MDKRAFVSSCSNGSTGRHRAAVQRRRPRVTRVDMDIAVLLSGGGRSLENVLQKIESGDLAGVNVKCVLASKKSAGGLGKAESRGIPTRVLTPKEFDTEEEFSDAITSSLDEFGVDLAVLAGWMHFYRIPDHYLGKVVNIHPSLIPAFCGKGYYGERVHRAVLDFGAKITGCTVHFADNEYDHGPIILQRSVPVEEDDDDESLAARVFESEKLALPDALRLLAEDRVIIDGRRVKIGPPSTPP
ncbi:hypothetical protein NDN08_005496 [Rhodosorus marinus]|uniref:phosphoribosylglycinamide formyltransferase 1 n=1 Tax=Rhodosorus marinus TaxID=101924 RepID=A0AAV8V4B1_9RHOD|nr:hypothetical protein NDN08_005496 [Rhodosorus marinus]